MKKPKIMAIANQKGGVGKTTTTFNIGAGLAKVGKKVLLIDLDPQANLSSYLGYAPKSKDKTIADLLATVANNQMLSKELISSSIQRNEKEQLDYIPSNISLSSADFFLLNAMCREKVLEKVLENSILQKYDYVIIDCLPSLGILLINALSCSNSLLVPVQAQQFALDGLAQLMNIYRMVKKNLNTSLDMEGVLVTMTDNTNMSKAVEEQLREDFGTLVFKSTISKSVDASYSTHFQKSLTNDKSSKLGEQYIKVTQELIRN